MSRVLRKLVSKATNIVYYIFTDDNEDAADAQFGGRGVEVNDAWNQSLQPQRAAGVGHVTSAARDHYP